MKRLAVIMSVAAIGLWVTGVSSSHAAIINSPGPSTGIVYEQAVIMGASDSATYTGSVGAKSWAEPGQAPLEKGWTHTVNWTALDLSGVGDPVFLTVQLSRGATGSLFPAFTLYQGWQTDFADFENNHTFNNSGNITWAPQLTYLDHVANGGGPNGTENGTGLTSVSRQFALTPGLYTLVYGGNPPFPPAQPGFHAFSATLTTAPVPVPAAVYLFGSGLIGLAGLARRRMAT